MKPIDVFIAYAQQDKKLMERLRKQLSTAERIGLVDAWHDEEIEIGTDRQKAARKAMQASEIILLLLSADFFASEYLYEHEMAQALELSKSGQAKVIPVLLKECTWQLSPLANLALLPKNNIPVTNEHWKHPDRAFQHVVEEVIHLSNALREKQGAEPIPYGKKTIKEEAVTSTNEEQETPETKDQTPLWRLGLYAFLGLIAFALISFAVNKAFVKPDLKKIPITKKTSPERTKTPVSFPTISLNGLDWTAKNANVTTEEAICYEDSEANCKRYGKLYTYETAMQLCPKGWRLPTRKEWLALTPKQVKKLALLKGGYVYRGAFRNLKKVGYYRTSERGPADYAWVMEFRGNDQPLKKEQRYTFSGMSCRCVR